MTLTSTGSVVDRLLRLCAAEGGSALYLMSRARPAVRVAGDIRVLGAEAALAPRDIEAALIDFIPSDALDGTDTTYAREVHGVGHVSCRALRDHRGPGVIFSMTPASLVLSTQRALTPEMLALCDEADGLIIVAGARAAGKSTLVGALVGHILQNRRDYVVTLENRIQAVHESRVSLVSQREVAPAQHAQGILAAVREGADVIVLDEIQTGAAAREVLEAARGHLVICALAAVDAASALDAYFDLLAAGERPAACETMSRVLRGVVAQRLARQNREGRFASRELLLNTPATSAMIAGGRFMHLSAELHA